MATLAMAATTAAAAAAGTRVMASTSWGESSPLRRIGAVSVPIRRCTIGMEQQKQLRRVAVVAAAMAMDSATDSKPIVHIDQDSDADATIVEISFGDRLGALLDTIKALKDLGLNVIRGVVTSEGPNMRRKKFLVTRSDNNKKVENPELLEAIRLTIINNLLQYHPESSEYLAMAGAGFGGTSPPPQEIDVDVATHITVSRDGDRSLLSVETADRPGLLLEILKVISDISIYVESAEIDTEGLVAKDRFHVTYHGDPLSKSMEEVLTNALRYYLRRPDTEEDSY